VPWVRDPDPHRRVDAWGFAMLGTLALAFPPVVTWLALRRQTTPVDPLALAIVIVIVVIVTVPIWGFGLFTLGLALDRKYGRDWVLADKRQRWYGRAHTVFGRLRRAEGGRFVAVAPQTQPADAALTAAAAAAATTATADDPGLQLEDVWLVSIAGMVARKALELQLRQREGWVRRGREPVAPADPELWPEVWVRPLSSANEPAFEVRVLAELTAALAEANRAPQAHVSETWLDNSDLWQALGTATQRARLQRGGSGADAADITGALQRLAGDPVFAGLMQGLEDDHEVAALAETWQARGARSGDDEDEYDDELDDDDVDGR
jgi:hypothetical protein